MKRSVVAMSLFAILAAATSAGCSSQHTTTEIAPSGSAPATAATSPSAAANKPGRIGDTLDLIRADDTKIAVTLEQIINPATVAGGTGEADKTYLAAKFKLTDSGSTPIEGDVNINVSLVGSDDQSYTADLNNVTECTNFESGAFHLQASESATGCVVFALPHGVSPVRVKYAPSAGFAPDFGEWLVK